MRSLGGFPRRSAGFSRHVHVKCGSHPAFTCRRFPPEAGGFLLRKGGGGDQGRPGIRTRRRRFTVQHPVQRCGVNAPSATDAAAKTRNVATPSGRGLHRYTHDRRRLPGSKIRSFNHRKTPHGCGDAEGFYRRSRVLSPCANARPCAFLPSEVPDQRTHRLG